MSEPYVVFVDHHNVLPQQQDNPICFYHCRAQGCFCGEPCIYRDVTSLRQAVQQGYTKARSAAAYPRTWLERTVQICHHGLVLLALDEAPVEHTASDEVQSEHKTRSTGPRAPRAQASTGRAVLDRATVVAQLTTLRREVEAANLPMEKFTPPFALVLSDVCRVLGLTTEEHDKILGPQAAAYVATIRKRRWWPVKGSPWRQLSRLLQQKGQVAHRAQ
jgi:hypothetical protein